MASELEGLADLERRLCEVLAAYFEAAKAGEAPEREVLLDRYPDLADQLAAFLDEQDRLLKLTEPLRSIIETAAGADPGRPCPNGDGAALLEANATVQVFDDYELIDEIARGGMGVVYRARQRSLNRLVALKMLRSGSLADGDDIRRFRLEAEAVAQLDHPNIVPIHEVGEHDGFSYLAMKLIEGASLGERPPGPADDPRAAARVVATVARAVHHAHQRGVLHRDLKPSNILIDAHGQPHVTDFGLARRLECDSELTRSGAILGTPSYMAPEQASGQRRTVTTATDVYGLGAVLYALLTGTPPFRGDSVLETLDQVRHAPPEPPSGVSRSVDRDLETICLKCLEKEPELRYGSALDLSEDLERWLRGEPIAAAAPSRWYRLRKFIRRNRITLATGGVVAFSLIAGTVVSAWQALRARQAALTAHDAEIRATEQRDAAVEARRSADEQAAITQAVNMFFIHDLLGHAALENQVVSEGRPDPDIKVRTVLDRAAQRIAGTFRDRPMVEAEIRQKISSLYHTLGLYSEALHHGERALDLRRRSLGSEAEDTIRSQLGMALMYRDQGRWAEAEHLLEATWDVAHRTFPPHHLIALMSQRNLAWVYQAQGKLAEADPLYRANLEVARRFLGPEDPNTLIVQENMASLLQSRGRLADAETLYRATLEVERRVLGLEHPLTLLCQNGLATLYRSQGDLAEAEALFHTTLEARRRLLGPEHHHTLITENELAGLYRIEGRLREAESLYRRTLEAARRVLGADHPLSVRIQNDLASLDRARPRGAGAAAGPRAEYFDAMMPNGIDAFRKD
jgi:tetratricopeptide (TPR) repeat protein